VISRRQFLRTGTLVGAGLLTWQASTQGQPTPSNLTGAWHADDGGIYYIRHLEDNSVWWAGLHNSATGCEKRAFHLGVWFTNVFQGSVNMGNRTIEGPWADLPRGSIMQYGQLSLTIETPSSGIELRQNPTGTTGGFGGRIWRPCVPQTPVDINYRFDHVRRYDSQFRRDNTPHKDFAVIFGPISSGDVVHLNWDASRLRDYCTFLNGEHENEDGDLNFNVYGLPYDDPMHDAGFWSTGWVNSPVTLPDGGIGGSGPVVIDASALIQRHLHSSANNFHCEVVMFGRTNNEADCAVAPNVLLPGWMETEGDSVLLNGRPINGMAHQIVGSDRQVEILDRKLEPGIQVRVTGVVNLDEHAMASDFLPYPGYNGAPEIHPVYSIDVIQDFEQPRPDADLTGVWHCDDVGTYYVRQVGSTVWWLGLSRDQGRSFANVFKGTLDQHSVTGEWADIPIGVGGAHSGGRLKLTGGINTPVPSSLGLGVLEGTGGFGGSRWTKLYDWPDPFFRG